MTPAVSILMPAFAAADTLGAALRSLQRQTVSSWECILVDDGSRDGTCDIAAAFAGADARIRVLARAHEGIVSALQAGLAECRAPLVARMDADDVMSRRRLELQLRAFEREPQLAGVGCHVRLFPRRELSAGLLNYERWLASIRTAEDVRREAFIECPIAHPTLLMRRDVLLRFGYRDAGWPEDYDLVLRLLEAGHALGVVPRRLLHWRDSGARLSRRSARYSIAAFVECKAEFLARSFLARSAHYNLWGFGDTGKALAAALSRRDKHPAAIIELHPGRLGQLIRGVRVVAPESLPSLPQFPLVVSVAGLTARTEIRAALTRMGFEQGRDYVCAA